MEIYKDLRGESGVYGYEIGEGYIDVQFDGGSIYRYTNQSAGSGNIADMQRLAKIGQGLNGFINRYVRYKYAERIR